VYANSKPVWKIRGLMSDTVYVLTVRGVTSVGSGDAASVSAATRPASR